MIFILPKTKRTDNDRNPPFCQAALVPVVLQGMWLCGQCIFQYNSRDLSCKHNYNNYKSNNDNHNNNHNDNHDNDNRNDNKNKYNNNNNNNNNKNTYNSNSNNNDNGNSNKNIALNTTCNVIITKTSGTNRGVWRKSTAFETSNVQINDPLLSKKKAMIVKKYEK